MSEDNFTFNARQYFNFNDLDEDQNVESYFDLGAEIQLDNKETVVEKEEKVFIIENEKSDSEVDETEFFSPMGQTISVYSDSAKIGLNKLRKSLSMCNIQNITEEKQDVAGCSTETLENQKTKRNNSVDSMNGLRKTSSQQHINRLAEPKRFKSQSNLNQNQFVSMAEATNKFQHGTPKRFRTTAKLCKPPLLPLTKTIAHSPKLKTQARYRPNTALSKEEQERMEFEENKKFKIRANPVNKKILREPVKIHPVEKKPTTVLQPFQITEVKKKDVKPSVPCPKPIFHAQPVPKSLHNPKKLEIKHLPTTVAVTPNFSKRLVKSSPKPKTNPVAVEKPLKLTKTQIMPFSFEKRDQELKKKKESYINKVLEEEKKAREFHANPLPTKILRSRNASAENLNNCAHSSKSSMSGDEPDLHVFRAKPAKVLTAKPFVPKKSEHVIEICEFNLATDQRKLAREEFERKIHEQNEEAERQKREQEAQLKLKEQEDLLQFRKQAEYKAQPIKKYKPVNIQPANKVTVPMTPNFHYEKRGKENLSH